MIPEEVLSAIKGALEGKGFLVLLLILSIVLGSGLAFIVCEREKDARAEIQHLLEREFLHGSTNENDLGKFRQKGEDDESKGSFKSISRRKEN